MTEFEILREGINSINKRLDILEENAKAYKNNSVDAFVTSGKTVYENSVSVSSTQDAMCEQTTRSADKVNEMESSICELTEMVGKLQSSSTTATS